MVSSFTERVPKLVHYSGSPRTLTLVGLVLGISYALTPDEWFSA